VTKKNIHNLYYTILANKSQEENLSTGDAISYV
jgi:hypothetical protein